MYERLDRTHDDVLGYEIGGEITESEFEELLQEMEQAIIDEGAVRLLVYMEEFPSFELDLLDEDIGFWLTHGDDIERYAVVGGESTLVDWATEFEDRISDIDVEHFDDDELDEAWEWVEE